MVDDTTSAAVAPGDEPDAPEASDLFTEARERYSAAIERDRENIREAYADLSFLAGEQWPEEIKRQREDEKRPALTINRLPQFVRQITGDIRQMRPAIKAVPVDSRGDPDTADVVAGLIRYIENRSDASSTYFTGADSQVQAGIGHWRVTTEYASDSTLDQEIAVRPVDDGVSVLWDPDATLLSREDAQFCFLPVDLSKRAFEKRYPGKSASVFGEDEARAFAVTFDWYGEDYVRVAEYFYREPVERTLLVLAGEVQDITDDTERLESAEALVQAAMAQGVEARIETRQGSRIMRAVLSGCEVLEDPRPWPGRFIPVVPCVGEEIRIGRKVVRFGAIRHARDPQRMYNYFNSAHTEIVALAPKAPWLGTEKNFTNHRQDWDAANTANLPYLEYTPDPLNGGQAPQRVAPPVSSQGISDGLKIAAEDLKATTGIYDASLGAASNETSGKAILARQREGDTGSYVYVERFGKAVAHTGRIIVDLIPHVYDTARTVRIVGEDGKEQVVDINKPAGLQVGAAIERVMHDVTVGAYDVVMEMGPSFSTKRQEALDGMTGLVQAAPQIAPLVLDLFAKGQDWPMADKIGERAELLLPPAIQAKLAQERGEPPAPPPPPSPEQQAAAAQAEREQALAAEQHRLDVTKLQLEARKLDVEMAKIEAERVAAEQDAMARAREADAAAIAAQAPAMPAADPRIEQMAEAIGGIREVLGLLVSMVAGAPPPAPEPPPPDPGALPLTDLVEPPPGGSVVPGAP